MPRARGGDPARDRRPGEEDAPHLGAGARRHRLPRDGPRARRPLPAERGPGAQDLDHRAWPCPRLHAVASERGQVPPDEVGAARPDGDDAGRPGRRGARLRRDHDGRGGRYRSASRTREADGHAPRDEREARPCACSAATAACRSSAGTSAPSPTTPTRSPGRSTTRSAVSSTMPTSARTRCSMEHTDDLNRLSRVLIEQETIDKDQFERLLAGESPDRVFPPPPAADPEDDDASPTAAKHAGPHPTAAAVPVARRARACAGARAGAADQIRRPLRVVLRGGLDSDLEGWCGRPCPAAPRYNNGRACSRRERLPER